MKEARNEALDRMVNEAEAHVANAIIGMRYQTAQVMNWAAEVIVYGTSVVVE